MAEKPGIFNTPETAAKSHGFRLYFLRNPGQAAPAAPFFELIFH
jgi:hypothetical protein